MSDGSDLFRDRLGSRLLVVAPHPDDETLGCGGLIAAHAEAGAAVHVLFVTDGGASHPRSKVWPRARLADLRRREAEEALSRLGVVSAERTFLGLADADMPPVHSDLWEEACDGVANLLRTSQPDLVCLPWRRDPHRDHRDACALVQAALAATGQTPRILEYAIWLDELGAPDDCPTAGEVDVLDLDIGGYQARKRHALDAHRSQLGHVVDDDPEGFVLTRTTIDRLVTPTERYFVPCR